MDSTSDRRDVFEHVFKQHYQHLCSYAYTLLKDRDSSEDVVQDLFIKVWEKQKTGLGPEKLKFYLFTAVRNNCLTLLKKNKKEPILDIKEEDIIDKFAIQNEPNEIKTDTKVLIAKALDQLPPKCKEVFLLSRLSKQTYKQIAETLGISVKTVENQMGKAIKLLKVFAKENGIYVGMLYFIVINIDKIPALIIFLENWID